jgi:hypothetical protein
MGILADFFVASPEDALRYESELHKVRDTSEMPGDRFERVEYKGFTGLELGMLWAIAVGEEWDLDRHMPANLDHGEEGETWLDEFPPELISVLASIRDQDVQSLAEAWGGTEELACEGSLLVPAIEDLRRLALSAQKQGKGMYLWGSL